MKFAHMADCHIGGWRDPKLKELGARAFEEAAKTCIKEDVDFVLISGDLFNTSLPAIDTLKQTVDVLKNLQDAKVPVYIIPGSHDFSPSGRTMLDVLESAGLMINVVSGSDIDGKLRLDFVKDKSGAKIAGLLGRKGTLEKSIYQDLDRAALEKETGFKIFMLHTALTELKSKSLENMDSAPISMLPKGFDYYAAGHVHERIRSQQKGYGMIVYPGPLFPNNFKELEDLKHGGFVIFEDGELNFEKIELMKVHSLDLDCDGMTPEEVESTLIKQLDQDFDKAIITIRLRGKIEGKISDIGFKEVFADFYEQGAYFVMKNTSALVGTGFEEVKIHEESVDKIEEKLIKEHSGQIRINLDEKKATQALMTMLSQAKEEGETKTDFKARILKYTDSILT